MKSAVEIITVKHTTHQPAETSRDVACDVCRQSTCVNDYGPQFGTLQAQWGLGSRHDGKRYEVRLCELCFFRTLSALRRELLVNTMFDAPSNTEDEGFGLVQPDEHKSDN